MMSSLAVRRVHEVFERFEARDVEGVVGLFAADGVFADPHYPPPIGPAMVGRQAIREGLSWGLSIVDQPHFAVRHELTGNSDAAAALEVDTNHRLVGGGGMVVTQVFMAEVDGDGLLSRMQSYTPYPPPAQS